MIVKFFKLPGGRGDDRCIGTGVPPRCFVEVDGQMADLPLACMAMHSDYEQGYEIIQGYPKLDALFEPVSPWLPHCGKIVFPNGQVAEVVDHVLEINGRKFEPGGPIEGEEVA